MPAFQAQPPSDETIQRWLDEAGVDEDAGFFDSDRWGGLTSRRFLNGLANWVAHKIVMETGFGSTIANAGQVSQKGVAPVLERMAKDPYMRTVYGQTYVELRDMAGMGGLAV